MAKLQGTLQVSVSRTKGILARLGQFLGRVDHLHGALLELHRIAIGSHCDADQTLCQINISVVIDADFCNHKTGLTFTDEAVTNSHGLKSCAHCCSLY